MALKSATPCEQEWLLFAGLNDHLHVAGLLEHLLNREPTPTIIWEAIQTLLAAMSEVQELVATRLGSKVVFTSSPGYAGMPPYLQFLYTMLILIAVGNGLRMLVEAHNRELGPVNLRGVGRCGAGVGRCVSCPECFIRARRHFERVGEVLCLEISIMARQWGMTTP